MFIRGEGTMSNLIYPFKKMPGHDGRISAMAGIFIILIFLMTAGCGKVSPGTAEVKRPVVSGVIVAQMQLSPVEDYYETSGTVKAKNIGVIASKIMGSITSVAVEEGQHVGRGQTLLTIDDSDIVQKVAAAASAVESARQHKELADVTFSRYAKLYEEKALSRQEFDQVGTQKKVAESELDRAQAMLRETRAYQGYAHVRAPFAGVVTGKKADPGSMAIPGMQLLTVEDTSAFLVEAAIDEKLSAGLKVGMPVEIRIDALDQNMKGKVSEVVPAIDPMSRTFTVKVALSGKGLKTGLYAKLKIPTGTRKALTSPSTAVVERGQLTGVYAVDTKGVVSYRLIRMGKHFGNDVEIISGLNPGDKIIVSGMDKAVDGGMIAEQKAVAPEK
jgi:RND family efflux transporter MFP subunit